MKIINNLIDSYINKIADEKIFGALVFGPSESLASYHSDVIAKKIVPDLSDPFLVVNINKERINADKGIVGDEMLSFSMFGGRKLIIVKSIDNSAANYISASLQEFFNSTTASADTQNFILIIAGDLDKNSSLRKLAESTPYLAAIACYEEDEKSISLFIKNKLTELKIEYNSEVINYLLEKLENNRCLISSELQKISLFMLSSKNKLLTIEIIDKLILSSYNSSIKELVDCFAALKFDFSLIAAERLFKNGFEAIALIRILTNYLQKLYLAKANLEKGADFESEVKSQKLFFKQEIEFRKHLKLNTLNLISSHLRQLNQLEIKIKSSNISSKLLFTNFVNNLIGRIG